ncbi:MAG TPA: LacI family DNA-binding transcriptional regulator [Rhodoglobus sp.]|mgnify:CR=1 FL=1|nr:LacI family DNA-binding transcriptional regulator [Rhodoglobus sp.]
MSKSTKRAGTPRFGVTLVDVARDAGVDQSTVSRVLRSDPGANVTDATRARIREAATRLGYVPNATARGLAMRRTSTIGLLVPNAVSLVFADIIRGATDAALELGYVLVLADASELGRASDAVRKLVLEGRVDGLLIASGTITDKITNDLIEGFHNCVVLNRRIGSRLPSVIEDDELGMFLCAQELIDRGHSEVACLAGPEDIDTSRRRLAGYRRAMREAGLPVRRGSVVHEPFDEAGGYRGMTRILQLRSPATAVASASLAAAVGAMAAARDRGISIPDQLSVTAFHDAPIANYLSPPLTTVAMPLTQVGREAVLMLDRRLRGEGGASHLTVREPAPQIIRRRSVGPPPVTP